MSRGTLYIAAEAAQMLHLLRVDLQPAQAVIGHADRGSRMDGETLRDAGKSDIKPDLPSAQERSLFVEDIHSIGIVVCEIAAAIGADCEARGVVESTGGFPWPPLLKSGSELPLNAATR
jgi:hypothetical protein